MTDDARLGSLPGDEALNPDTAEAASVTEAQPEPASPADGELLALIDRLALLLDRSDLSELEVEAGRTGLVLRKPAALPAAVTAAGASGVAVAAEAGPTSHAADAAASPPARPAVTAPRAGIFYASPAPGSAPYVQVGGEVAVGQVIGLIEAMKLFNEIKSDLAGRVVKVVAESGALVKAKQPLVEVEPL